MLMQAPLASADRPARLNFLAYGLGNHYDRSKDLADLEHAISLLELAIEQAPADFPDLPVLKKSLSSALMKHYAITGSEDDLEKGERNSQGST